MNATDDDASARFGAAGPARFTRIDIDTRHTRVTTGIGSAPDATLNLVLGSLATGERFFKHEPPPPHELERAIDAVEDEVMRARGMIPPGSALVSAGAALHEFGRAAGVTEAGEAVTIEAVERLFQRLASASLGDPMARRGLPTGNRFVACALILREFMHHLGFTSITFPERDG